jgi:hypothetical protein
VVGLAVGLTFGLAKSSLQAATLADLPLGPGVRVSNRPIFVDSIIIDQQGEFSFPLPVYWNLKN